jgi:hypothetical protein
MLGPRRSPHGLRMGRFDTEPERSERVGSHIDGKSLDWRQWQWNAEQRKGEVGNELGDIVNEDVCEEFADV